MSVAAVAFACLMLIAASLSGLMLAASMSAAWGAVPAIFVTAVIAIVAVMCGRPPVASQRCNRTLDLIGVAAVAANVAASLVWAYLYSSQQVSDFGVYYRCGFGLLPRTSLLSDPCQSYSIDYGSLHLRRSALYTVPIAWFGGDYSTLKIANASLQGITGAILWLLSRRFLGSLPALISILVFALFPERLLSITLATSDHVALLLTVFGLWCIVEVPRRSWPAKIAVVVALGMTVIALDLTRSTGVFLLGASAAACVICWVPGLGAWRSGLLFTVFVGSVVVLAMIPAYVFGPTGDGLLRVLSSLHIDPSGEGTARWAWTHHFWPTIPASERTLVAIRRIVDEITLNWPSYPGYIFEKAKILTRGGGYSWFATVDLAGEPDTVLTIQKANVPEWFNPQYGLARLWLLPTLALSFAGSIRAPRNALVVVAMGFFAVSVGVVILLGEVQARYSLISLPAMAILAGAALACQPSPATPRSLGKSRWVVGLLGVAGLACLGVGYAIWGKPSAQAVMRATATDEGGCPTRADQIVADTRQILLHLAPGDTCASARVIIHPPVHRLTFFLSDGQFPSRFETAPSKGMSYKLETAGLVDDGTLADAHLLWKDLAIRSDNPVELLLTARRAEDRASEDASLSFAYPMVWR